MIYFGLLIVGLLMGLLTNFILENIKIVSKASMIEKLRNSFSFTNNKIYFVILCINIAIMPLLYLKYHDVIFVIKTGAFLSLLFPCAYLDYRFKIIPNSLVGLICVLGIVVNILYWDLNYTFASIIALIGLGLLFIAVYFLSKGSVGMGDVKLLTVTSFLFGLGSAISILFITFLISAIAGVALLFIYKKDSKYEVAFAPMLLVGYVICIVFNFI